MNASAFRRNVIAVITIYSLSLAVGVALAIPRLGEPGAFNGYTVWKDMQPLIIAIPAAWLGYCVQRRLSYLKDVRELWAKMVPAYQAALQYTHATTPLQTDYAATLMQLSIVIDDIRGVFRNVDESDISLGFFPLESFKTIHRAISDLGWGKVENERRDRARADLKQSWTITRYCLLRELPRGVPEKPDVPSAKRYREWLGTLRERQKAR